MANPGVELAWAGGIWHSRDRRVVKPTVQTAIDFVQIGFDEIGLSFTEPKCVNVWRCGRSEDTWASSNGPTDIDLHIRVDHIQHRKVPRFLADIALAIGHDTIHAIRSEYCDDPSLIEHIASEGLAWVGEDPLEHVILGAENASQVADVVALTGSNYQYSNLKAQLSKQRDHTWEQDGAEDSLRQQWLEPSCRLVPPGLVVGITEVQRRLEEGNTLGDLMTWSAEQILDLGVAA